jgi:hypothetical protein
MIAVAAMEMAAEGRDFVAVESAVDLVLVKGLRRRNP